MGVRMCEFFEGAGENLRSFAFPSAADEKNDGSIFWNAQVIANFLTGLLLLFEAPRFWGEAIVDRSDSLIGKRENVFEFTGHHFRIGNDVESIVLGEKLFFKRAGFAVMSADTTKPGGEGIVFRGLSLEVGGVDSVASAEDISTRDAFEAEKEGGLMFGSRFLDGSGKLGGRVRGEFFVMVSGPGFFRPGSVVEESGGDSFLPQSSDEAG